MDATARILALAPLLWPDGTFDVGLHACFDGIDASLYTDGDETPLGSATAPNGVDALNALAAQLSGLACDRAADLLRAAGAAAPTPGPSRDELAAHREQAIHATEHAAELAARLAECKRELATAARQYDDLRRSVLDLANGARIARGRVLDDALGETVADALRRLDDAARLAARVDREPPQRAPGLGAGVADLIDAEVRHMDFVAGCSESPVVADVCRHLADRLRPVAAAARQHDGGAVGRGKRVERGQEGAADVGGVAEAAGVERRIVLASGRATIGVGGCPHVGDANVERGLMLRTSHLVAELDGRDVAIVAEVLRGEGGGDHSESVGPATAEVKSP